MILAAVKASVVATAWVDNGGTSASLVELNGQLIVHAPRRVQAGVADLLEDLAHRARQPRTSEIERALRRTPGIGAAPDALPAVVPAADGNARLAFRLLPQLHHDNLVYSPYSAWTCLAILQTAAHGKTQEELSAVLGMPDDARLATDAALLSKLLLPAVPARPSPRPAADPDAPAVITEMSNTWFAGPHAPVKADFAAAAATHFGLTVVAQDFSDPQRAADAINAAVRRQTHDRIAQAVLPAQLPKDKVAFVLTSSLYFKAAWDKPFAPEDTRPATFFIPGEKPRSVAMMARHDTVMDYAETADCRVLRIPYAGGTHSMVVVLPTDLNGLPAVEKDLTAMQWQRLLSRMAPRAVNLYLPRFTLTDTHELIAPLQALGLHCAIRQRHRRL